MLSASALKTAVQMVAHAPPAHRLPLIRCYLKLTHEFEIKKFFLPSS